MKESKMTETRYIGMDVGGTTTKISLVNAMGQILDYRTIPSNLKTPLPDRFLADVSAIITHFTKEFQVSGMGIALCSLVNKDQSGAFLAVNAPALNNLDIKSAFESRFGFPVRVINDVNAFALAEYHLGAGRDTQRLLCLALGTGLAISVLLKGQVIENWGGVAADAARIILEPSSQRRCQAGVPGSAEALIGTAYIEDRARELYGRKGLNAHQVISAARDDADLLACQIITEVGHHAGHLLALLSPVFFPQRIVITGGTAQAGECLFSAIRQRYQGLIGAYFQELTYLETGERGQPVQIVKGVLGPDAATIGAVLNIVGASVLGNL
jgi:glucokinase